MKTAKKFQSKFKIKFFIYSYLGYLQFKYKLEIESMY